MSLNDYLVAKMMIDEGTDKVVIASDIRNKIKNYREGSLGSFESKAGRFVGRKMFGYEKRDGHCITNLGRVESNVISEAVFIPPASPANRKAWGVLTINKKMRICSIHSR